MSVRTKSRMAPWLAICLAVCLGCSGGTGGGPVAGTPEWYWLAAVENFQKADFSKTEQHLDELMKTESPWRARATAWRAVLLAGLSSGYKELGAAFAEGAVENKGLAQELQNPIQQYRRDARQYAIKLAENLPKIREILAVDDRVALEFPFPSGSANPSPVLTAIRSGQAVPKVQWADAAADTLKRHVVLETTAIVGAGDDVNGARSTFEKTPVEVDTAAFLLRLGGSLREIADLFDRRQLNEPQVREIILKHALDCISPALEAESADLKKEAEQLRKDIEKEQSKMKA